VEKRKARFRGESGPVLQIVLDFEAKEPASVQHDSEPVGQGAEANLPPSGARAPAAAKEGKRKWYSLYDKVFALKGLCEAWERVRRNGGVAGCDGQTVEQFEERLEENLQALHEQLRQKRYRPRPVKRVEIPKVGGGQRRLGIPSVRDRVVQQALLQVLTPIFEAKFSPRSHGFRPGRGCNTALEVVDQAIRHGYEWVVDADICQFFDEVDHELLLTLLNEEISDGSVLRLVRAFLESGTLMDGGEWETATEGTPQGGPLSPLLANIYLHPLDRAMQGAGFGLVRYADDFVIFARSRERAEEALALVRRALEGLKLRLHPEKTRVTAIDEGFDFLGYHYFRDRQGRVQKDVSRKSRQKFRERIRKLTRRHAGQKRPKASRCTLQRLQRNRRVGEMVAQVNEYLRDWHVYFRGVRVSWARYWERHDGYVRQRLRNAITGRYAKGLWHVRLPNALFAALGLVSLTTLNTDLPHLPLKDAPNSGYPGGSRMR